MTHNEIIAKNPHMRHLMLRKLLCSDSWGLTGAASMSSDCILSLWCSSGNFTLTLLKSTLMHFSTILPINTWQKLHQRCLLAALSDFALGPSEPRTQSRNSTNYHKQILDSFSGRYKTKRVALTFPVRE